MPSSSCAMRWSWRVLLLLHSSCEYVCFLLRWDLTNEGGDSRRKDRMMMMPPRVKVNARPKTLKFECAEDKIF